MIFLQKPENFNIRFEIVALNGEFNNKLLLVKRVENKAQGGMWSLVAGKVESGESLYDAMIREAFEETGLVLVKDKLNLAQSVYVEHDGYQFIFHSFAYKFDSEPNIKLNFQENTDHQWLSVSEIIEMENLMPDEADCLKLLYKL